jgi:hypothetical protein
MRKANDEICDGRGGRPCGRGFTLWMPRSAAYVIGLVLVTAGDAAVPPDYKGIPYVDSVFQGPSVIPGRVQCVYFDYGGEGVAFHSDGTNHGNQDFNLVEHRGPKCSLYISQFRANEGASISFTSPEHKDHWYPQDAPSPFDPSTNQLYIGWTKDGQWLNYTVDVKTAGTYKVSVLYGNYGKEVTPFKLSINHQPAGDYKFPVLTGSAHAWYLADVGTITFPEAGLQLLTLTYNRGNNLAYIDFDLIEKKQ